MRFQKWAFFYIRITDNFDLLSFHFAKVGQALQFCLVLGGQVGRQSILPQKI